MDISRKTWFIVAIVAVLLLIGLLAVPFLRKPEDIERLKSDVRMGMTAVEVQDIAQIRPLSIQDHGEYSSVLYVQPGAAVRVHFQNGRADSMSYETDTSDSLTWVFSEQKGIPDADGTVTLPDDLNGSVPYPGR